MRLFAETVEEIASEEASTRRLFSSQEDGVRIRGRKRSPKYMRSLLEASRFVEEIHDGRRPMHHLQEAMSTSDFPTLFGDILDRQMLGAYREMTPVWQQFIRRSTVPDFRPVLRRSLDGAEGQLLPVDELEEYPEAALEESEDTYKVRKYGRRLDLSWETLVNDDLDSFRDAPQRLARGARRTEQRFATTLYVGANGPRGDLYTSGHGNIIPGNPELSREALEAGLNLLNGMVDVDGEPIVMDYAILVIPPTLEVTANQILQATIYRQDVVGGQVEVNNWLQNRLRLVVDPYIPYVASGPEGRSSWFLFADPGSGRAFAEMAFLRGYEDPGLYERVPDSRRVGGGDVEESFDTDSRAWKVRHVLGGGLLNNTRGYLSTAASNGGSSS